MARIYNEQSERLRMEVGDAVDESTEWKRRAIEYFSGITDLVPVILTFIWVGIKGEGS